MLTPSGRFHPDKKICFSMSDFHPGSWNPAWSVATILTGLLSFMLSDEMTTGSVNSGDAQKRQFSSRSHAWNLTQVRFKEAFPDYCTQIPKDVPNMGGQRQHQPPPPSLFNPPTQQMPSFANLPPSTPGVLPPASTSDMVKPKPADEPAPGAAGAAISWGEVLWDKWRWGVLIAIAVVVSRLSSARS
ncbi:hypothetical protein D9757_013288 [Collybiopsis confluens]|nr:hypothetical protein D9757_013288 [Collybiopsis confluens]